MEPVFSREQLLSEWKVVHGRSPRKLHDEFLKRQELRELGRYPKDVIQRAMRSDPRLKRILAEGRSVRPCMRIAVEKMSAKPASASCGLESLP